jgi:hypothetical protein
MRKIHKNIDINNIPKSLIPALEDLFDDKKIPITSETTHKRRLEVIDFNKYIDEDNYNSRYKLDDIKVILSDIYCHKCAFCEQRIEQVHVEHYRPKKENEKQDDSHGYYWLAFSWDNLLIACPTCNTFKSSHFKIKNSRVVFDNKEENIKNINSLSSLYDIIEQPLMVNPEVTEPIGYLIFSQDGKIGSEDERFQYTIETCHLDRTDLNDQRRKILEDFKNDVRSELVESKDVEKQKETFETLYRCYVRKLKDTQSTFLAFRDYSIKQNWPNQFVKSII